VRVLERAGEFAEIRAGLQVTARTLTLSPTPPTPIGDVNGVADSTRFGSMA
jgi:hypothetical protein